MEEESDELRVDLSRISKRESLLSSEIRSGHVSTHSLLRMLILSSHRGFSSESQNTQKFQNNRSPENK